MSTNASSMPTPSFVTTVNGKRLGPTTNSVAVRKTLTSSRSGGSPQAPIATPATATPMPWSKRRREMSTGVGRLTDAPSPATAS